MRLLNATLQCAEGCERVLNGSQTQLFCCAIISGSRHTNVGGFHDVILVGWLNCVLQMTPAVVFCVTCFNPALRQALIALGVPALC
jgi:hypothetical protein